MGDNDVFHASSNTYVRFDKNKDFFLMILFIFRERRREGKKEEEKHQCVVASHTPPTGDLVLNSGSCPDWEMN